MANRIIPEINAGSMADIAFLLLVYFLVTTTINTDTGISVLLPPPPDESVISCGKNNAFTVRLNQFDELQVRDKQLKISELKARMKAFVMEEAESPKKATILFYCDNGTSYNAYLTAYNELKAAYNELWDAKATQLFGQKYEALRPENKQLVRAEIPLVISEAETTGFGH